MYFLSRSLTGNNKLESFICSSTVIDGEIWKKILLNKIDENVCGRISCLTLLTENVDILQKALT